MDFLELAACVRPVTGQYHWPACTGWLGQAIVACISIDLQDAIEARQKPLSMLAATSVRRLCENSPKLPNL
jgi:hypothetical protein